MVSLTQVLNFNDKAETLLGLAIDLQNIAKNNISRKTQESQATLLFKDRIRDTLLKDKNLRADFFRSRWVACGGDPKFSQR